MRWLYIGIVTLFVIVMVIFAVQNLELVTVAFLGFSARAPLALVAVLIYLLGMATGSSLLALLKKSIEAARRHPQ
jgi:lipopolysaccharide assembly protein A